MTRCAGAYADGLVARRVEKGDVIALEKGFLAADYDAATGKLTSLTLRGNAGAGADTWILNRNPARITVAVTDFARVILNGDGEIFRPGLNATASVCAGNSVLIKPLLDGAKAAGALTWREAYEAVAGRAALALSAFFPDAVNGYAAWAAKQALIPGLLYGVFERVFYENGLTFLGNVTVNGFSLPQ